MNRFTETMRVLGPVYESGWKNGLHIYKWQNPEFGGMTRLEMPETARKRIGRIKKEGHENILLVSDSFSESLKFATLAGEHKRIVKNAYGRGNQYIPDYTGKADVIDVNLRKVSRQKNAEAVQAQLSKLSNTDTVLFSELQGGNLSDENLQIIMSCSAGCSIVNISEELMDESGIQTLIYEAGYDVVYFPKLPEDYYKKLTEKLFIQPIFMAIFQDGKTLDEADMDEYIAKSGYVEKVNINELTNAVNLLQRKREGRLLEGDIARFLDLAEDMDWNWQSLLQSPSLRTVKDLEKYKGLETFAEVVKRHVAMSRAAKRKGKKSIGRRYIFEGNPGSGKTESAKLQYEVLSSAGGISGSFVLADRKDVIGSYVGQTAPKVGELFARARDGVLFFDEAGYFLQRESGGFVMEALKEIVRYMEQYRDVTVIFALYPGEKEAFLNMDAGLSSRIDKVLYFKDYNEEELCGIAEKMAGDEGYCLAKGYEEMVGEYIREQRNLLKEQFGNAREMRKFVGQAIEEFELRCYENGVEDMTEISLEDIQRAIKQLQNCEELCRRKPFGFRIEQEEKTLEKLLCRLA